MTKSRRFFPAAIAACALMVASPLAAQDETLETYDADTPLVTIGERVITLGDMIRARQELAPQLQSFPDEVIFEGMLQEMIRREVFAAAAVTSGVADQPDIAAELEAARQQILANAYLAQAIEPQLTDETVRARYDELVAEAPQEEEVSARHILVETEETAIEVKAEADGGADFAELAKERSTGPSGPAGGDLGFFTFEDMVPEFAEAAFALQPGEISEPVQTSFGWHVIKVEERRQVPPPAFEELAQQIARELAQEFATAEVEALTDDVGVVRAETLPPAAAIREDALLEGAQ